MRLVSGKLVLINARRASLIASFVSHLQTSALRLICVGLSHARWWRSGVWVFGCACVCFGRNRELEAESSELWN